MPRMLHSPEQNKSYEANNIRQSLQGTNIRSNDIVNENKVLICTLEKGSSNLTKQQDNKSLCGSESEDVTDQVYVIDNIQPETNCNQEEDIAVDRRKLSFTDTENILIPDQLLSDKSIFQCENQHKQSEPFTPLCPYPNNNQSDKEINDLNCHRRGNMHRKETDCAGTGNISIQMFRYLQHTDMKQKIMDLRKREHTCVMKHYWDEALRLREMRNNLILKKNENFYNNQDLQIDDETRDFGMNIIRNRQAINTKRQKMCNSLLYSEEAKILWQQWKKEDDELLNAEKHAMSDVVLNKLENEWKNLAMCDKNRMSQLYKKIMTKSELQDEHKLAAILQDANLCQKQYMNYLAT